MPPAPTRTLPGHTSPLKSQEVQHQQQQLQQESCFTTKTQPGRKNTMSSNNTLAQAQSQSQSQEANQRSCSAFSDKNKRALWATDTPPPFASSSHQSCYSGDDCTNNSTPSTLLSSASTIKSKASVDEVMKSDNSYERGMGDGDGHLDMHTTMVSRQQLLEIPDLEEGPHSAGRVQVNPSLARSGSGSGSGSDSGSRQFQNTSVNTNENALGGNTANTDQSASQYNELSNFRFPRALLGPNTNANTNAPSAAGSAAGPPSHVNIFTKPSARIHLSSHWTQPSYQQIASRNQHQVQSNNVQSQAGSHFMNVPPDYYSAPMQPAPQTPQRPVMSYARQSYHQTPLSGSGRARSASVSEHTASRNPMHSPSQHTWTHQRQNLNQRQNPHQHQPSRTAHHMSGNHTLPNSPSGHHPRQPFSPGGARSAPEHLKTLLRKKACLYEPGTSRAIALITWLVGRKLALHNGYFSRQKLQSGVHAVVAKKIDSDLITRTKVNRCMQIILNSCFHYIIPRPDGTEENGEAFRTLFKESVADDTHLLKSLLAPWDDLDILEADKVVNCEDEILFEDDDEHCCNEGKFRKVKAPKNSKANKEKGKHKSSKSSSLENVAGDSQSQKRKVLLCFNENVRSAEDVLRCHNEFIRDAAISSDLHLSSDEWKYFYSRKDDDESQTIATADSTTSYGPGVYSSPMLRGNEGRDNIPYLSFDIPPEVSDSLAFNDPDSSGRNADALGQMNCNELFKFRTTWCCKRYEHDAKLCRFAHVNENSGWLRRDPNVYEYADNLCPSVATITNIDSIINGCRVNACKDGLLCKFAHSQEEVEYHLTRYKNFNCTNETRPCNLLDICPHSHTFTDHRHRPNRNRGDSISSGRGLRNTSVVSLDGGNGYEIPAGSPVLYLSPAPMSEFDNSFNFAGLQSLFRRNCTVYYAHHTGVEGTKYDLFKDTCGIEKPLFGQEDGNGSFSLYTN